MARLQLVAGVILPRLRGPARLARQYRGWTAKRPIPPKPLLARS